MLQLRQKIEDVFEKFGLENFHIERTDNGVLQIVGKCGHPFINIYGINVPKKINFAERGYIFKLISKFVIENNKDIRTAMKYRKELKKPIVIKNFEHVRFATSSYDEDIEMKDFFKDGDKNSISYVIDKENKVFINFGSSSNYYSENDIKEALKHLKESKKVLIKYKKLHEENKTKQDFINNINSCNL